MDKKYQKYLEAYPEEESPFMTPGLKAEIERVEAGEPLPPLKGLTGFD
ncbi:hypothetical protein KIPB_013250, partial [Kipferlia bialata]|eukprot:g13250.t1